MQQPSSSGTLAGLLNMGSLQRKYVGVLKSRAFVEEAEKVANLKGLYDLDRPSEVIEKYNRCVKFDDNATDGLIYITVTLDAPAIFIWNESQRREQVRQTAAVIANTYYKSLINYLVNTDSDKELVLLRAADSEVAQSRLNYDTSMNRLARFVRSRKLKANAMPSMPTASSIMSGSPVASASPDSGAAATQFLALFSKKAQLEAQIAAASTLHTRLQAMLTGPLQEVADIPGEDPLLFVARSSYNEAHRTYETLRLQLGAENPRLISAKSNLDVAEKRLKSEVRSVLAGNTTEHLNLVTLQTTYQTVSRQVGDAEKNFQTSRELTTDLGRLTAEVALNLKVLETAKTAAETLKMTTVAGRNRANLVDTAIPEDRSHPGRGMLFAISLLLAATAVGLWGAIEYNIVLRHSDAS